MVQIFVHWKLKLLDSLLDVILTPLLQQQKEGKALLFLFRLWRLLETTHPGFRNQFYSFRTCGTDGIKKAVIVIGANKSARKYDGVEGNVILCHELMKSDLEHTIPLG